MFLIDQLRSPDQRLRWVSFGVLGGLGILFAGLWYIQIYSGKRFEADVKGQLYRTVRLPAVRGKILDRNGFALAENRPRFEINLYLEELRRDFRFEYTNRIRPEFIAANPTTRINGKISSELESQARFAVVNNIYTQIGQRVGLAEKLSASELQKFYLSERTLPFPLAQGLSPQQVARFAENFCDQPSLALNTQLVRSYPFGTAAAHILGHLTPDDSNREDEEFNYQFRLPDFAGASGMELAFEKELRGKPGMMLVTVNSMQYRQAETVLVKPQPGNNVVLTIDQKLQRTVDVALGRSGPKTRGAVVVMDVSNGDIMAISSSPTFDPKSFTEGASPEEAKRLLDPDTKPQFNRAMRGAYLPGSIFKIVVALAGLENNVIKPKEVKRYEEGFTLPGGHWEDTAGPGNFDFRRAFALSSNPYFQTHGLQIGALGIIEMGRRLGLGQPTGISKVREVSGYFPKASSLPLMKNGGGPWRPGDTANLSIGQGEVSVTPLQMAVLLSAVANSGKVFQPRLVMRIDSSPESGVPSSKEFPAGQIRNIVDLKPSTWDVLHQAMIDDVEYREPGDKPGSGWRAAVPNLRIAGKTGTAETEENGKKGKATWFVSYAPATAPRYAVVVVIEDGASGGLTCAPIAREIYAKLLTLDPKMMVQNN